MAAAIDLNNTSPEELKETLGITKYQAENICDYIEDNGKIIEEMELLLNVPGVGEKTYNRIEEHIYVGEVERPPKMTTREYRKKHKREIQLAKKTGDELDVCHIISHHNGGADHEDNYVLAGAHFNREIQDKHDNLMSALVGVEKMREAIRISRLQKDFKMSVDDAEELVESGREDFRKFHKMCTYEEQEEMISMYDDQLDRHKLQRSDYCKHVIRVWKHGHGKLRRGRSRDRRLVKSDLWTPTLLHDDYYKDYVMDWTSYITLQDL